MRNTAIKAWTSKALLPKGKSSTLRSLEVKWGIFANKYQIWLGQCQLCVWHAGVAAAYATGPGHTHTVPTVSESD